MERDFVFIPPSISQEPVPNPIQLFQTLDGNTQVISELNYLGSGMVTKAHMHNEIQTALNPNLP